jgi:hypothetical protein
MIGVWKKFFLVSVFAMGLAGLGSVAQQNAQPLRASGGVVSCDTCGGMPMGPTTGGTPMGPTSSTPPRTSGGCSGGQVQTPFGCATVAQGNAQPCPPSPFSGPPGCLPAAPLTNPLTVGVGGPNCAGVSVGVVAVGCSPQNGGSTTNQVIPTVAVVTAPPLITTSASSNGPSSIPCPGGNSRDLSGNCPTGTSCDATTSDGQTHYPPADPCPPAAVTAPAPAPAGTNCPATSMLTTLFDSRFDQSCRAARTLAAITPAQAAADPGNCIASYSLRGLEAGEAFLLCAELAALAPDPAPGTSTSASGTTTAAGPSSSPATSGPPATTNTDAAVGTPCAGGDGTQTVGGVPCSYILQATQGSNINVKTLTDCMATHPTDGAGRAITGNDLYSYCAGQQSP